MNNIIIYLAESGGCLVAFYIFYKLLLQKETFFQYNRLYLLVTPILSFLFPLITLPSLPQYFSFSTTTTQTQPVLITSSIITSNPSLYPSGTNLLHAPSPVFQPLDLAWLIWIVYGLGVCFFAYRLVKQLLIIKRLIQQYATGKYEQRGIIFIPTQGQLPTFSFLNYIFLDNTKDLNHNEKAKILQHESVHIYQKHTWDILYFQLLIILFWFNPVLYFYKKDLTDTHEFIADAEVLRTSNQKEYAALLIKQVFRQMDLSISHFFNKSLTLKRMKMLKKNHLQSRKAKLALVFPLMALLLLLASSKNTSIAENTATPTEINAFNLNNGKRAKNKITDPVFPGGKAALKDYLRQNFNYPAEALINKITGQALIQATIAEDGKLENFKTLQADNAYFEQEAIRVLKEMPRWQPAIKDGKTIRVDLAFPFIFGLETNKNLPTLKVPETKNQFILQDAFTIIGYNNIVTGKIGLKKSILPTSIQKVKADSALVKSNWEYTKTKNTNNIKAGKNEYTAPRFVGGDEAMFKFFLTNLHVNPVNLGKNKGVGIFIELEIDKDGNFKKLGESNYNSNSVNDMVDNYIELDNDARRVTNNMPRWIPAKKNEKAITCRYLLNITHGNFDNNVNGIKPFLEPDKPRFDSKDLPVFDAGVIWIDINRLRTPAENATQKKSAEELKVKTETDTSPIFTFVEQPAGFPGGETAMQQFIKENLHYPAEAKANKTSGVVILRFVVDKAGKTKDFKVVKDLGYGTATEALRLANLFPDFTPAKQNGKLVVSEYILPIGFNL